MNERGTMTLIRKRGKWIPAGKTWALTPAEQDMLRREGLEDPQIIAVRFDARGDPDILVRAKADEGVRILWGIWRSGEGVADIRWEEEIPPGWDISEEY